MSHLNKLRQREVGNFPNAYAARRDLSTDAGFIHRLALTQVLEGHDGCVNCVSFHPGAAELLISGSDDRRIKFWDWQRGKEVVSFHSGHRNNVFQAKMLPNLRHVVSCAADGQVRLNAILPDGSAAGTCKIGAHGDRAHKLALDPMSPFSFLSCGEDGEVRHFDTREPNYGNRRLLVCKSFDARANRARPVSLFSIACNTLDQAQFALAGNEPFVRVYDRRAGSNDRACSVSGWHPGSSAALARPVRVLAPNHLRGASNKKIHITAAVFSCRGEVLATYNDEDIYLFAAAGVRRRNVGAASAGAPLQPRKRRSPEQASEGPEHATSDRRARGNAQRHATGLARGEEQPRRQEQQTAPGAGEPAAAPHHAGPSQAARPSAARLPSPAAAVPATPARDGGRAAAEAASSAPLRASTPPGGHAAAPACPNKPGSNAAAAAPETPAAAATSAPSARRRRRAQDPSRGPGGAAGAGPAAAAAGVHLNQEVDQVSDGAVGGGPGGAADGSAPALDQGAAAAVLPAASQGPRPAAEQNVEGAAIAHICDALQINPTDWAGVRRTLAAREAAAARSAADADDEEGDDDDPEIEYEDLGDDEFEDAMVDEEGESSDGTYEDGSSSSDWTFDRGGRDSGADERADSQYGNAPSQMTIVEEFSLPTFAGDLAAESDAWPDAAAGGFEREVVSVYRPRAQRQGSRGPREGAIGTSDDDAEAEGGEQGSTEDFVLQRYSGHRNRRTVKGVSFFGSGDEWVVSGSDCGHVFVWDRATARLHGFLRGDDAVVNCLEPHPTLPCVLATSGIDSEVKVWEPTLQEPRVPGREAEEAMERNQRRHQLILTPHMLANLLQRRLMRRSHLNEGEPGAAQSSEEAGPEDMQALARYARLRAELNSDDDQEDRGCTVS